MKKKILFVNDEMTMGGVARILNTLLKLIDKDKYAVDVLILHPHGELMSEIPEGVRLLPSSDYFSAVDRPLKLCRGKELWHKLALLADMKSGRIKKKIAEERKRLLDTEYDIEFAAKEGFCTLFVAYGNAKKKINWVQVDYKQNNYSSHHMSLMKDALTHIDHNIACSSVVKESYTELFGVDRISVVHNPVDEDRIRSLSYQCPDIKTNDAKINLICVARFHPQKGVDRLIRCYAENREYYKLVIIGDGELNRQYHELAKSLGVDEEIDWHGISKNPYPDIRLSDCLVMPSLYEGYPTLTIESFLSSTPVLCTEVAGVKEQFLSPENGWIVCNNEESLLDKLLYLRNKKELLKAYKQSLLNYHYPNEAILNEYERLFNEPKTH